MSNEMDKWLNLMESLEKDNSDEKEKSEEVCTCKKYNCESCFPSLKEETDLKADLDSILEDEEDFDEQMELSENDLYEELSKLDEFAPLIAAAARVAGPALRTAAVDYAAGSIASKLAGSSGDGEVSEEDYFSDNKDILVDEESENNDRHQEGTVIADGHMYFYEYDKSFRQGVSYLTVHTEDRTEVATVEIDDNSEFISVDFSNGESTDYPYNEYQGPEDLAHWVASISSEYVSEGADNRGLVKTWHSFVKATDLLPRIKRQLKSLNRLTYHVYNEVVNSIEQDYNDGNIPQKFVAFGCTPRDVESLISKYVNGIKESTDFQNTEEKINNPDYIFYVLVNDKIESGWEYKEDAIDHVKGNLSSNLRKSAKIGSKRALMSVGIDPDENSNWATAPTSEGAVTDFAADVTKKVASNTIDDIFKEEYMKLDEINAPENPLEPGFDGDEDYDEPVSNIGDSEGDDGLDSFDDLEQDSADFAIDPDLTASDASVEDVDVADMLASIQYYQDMNMSNTDKHYDTSKLQNASPDLIKRIYSKVTGEAMQESQAPDADVLKYLDKFK